MRTREGQVRGGGVMVWGGITGGRKTRLIAIRGNMNAARYINEILTAEVIPFLQRNGPGTFQQDNARPHTAVATRNHLAASNVNVLPRPAVSPDLNPIEHIWDELGETCATSACAKQCERVNALLNAHGGHNRY